MAGHFGANPYKWEGGGANSPHVTRYLLARGWIMPWETVVDAGCGTGYGTKLIALAAKKVYGLEVDEGCVADANRDKPENCEFKVHDLGKDELPDCDVLISIESMEHVDGLAHYIEQIHKHVKRCVVITVPLGGTSQAYVNEPPSPATEKNDFIHPGDLHKLIAPDGSEWKTFNDFQYGYSIFAVYYRKEIEKP